MAGDWSIDNATFLQQVEDTVALVRFKAAELTKVTNEAAALRSQLSTAEAAITACTAREQDLQRRLADANSRVATANAALEDLTASSAMLNTRLEAAIAADTAARAAAAEAIEARNAAVAETQKLQVIAAQAVATASTSKEAEVNAKAALAAQTEEMGKAAKAADAAKKRHAEQLAAVEKEKQELNRHLVNIMDEMKSASTRADQARRELEAAQSEIAGLVSDRDKLTATLQTMHGHLETAKSDNKRHIQQTAAQVAEKDRNIGVLQEQVNTLTARATQAEEHNAALEAALAAAQTQHAQESEATGKVLTQLKAQLQAALDQADLNGKEQEQLRATQVANLEATIQELKNAITDKELAVLSMKDQVAAATKETQELQRRMDTRDESAHKAQQMLRAEADGLREKLRQIIQERDRMQQELRKSVESSQTLQHRLQDAEEELGAVKQATSVQVRDFTTQIATLQAKLEEATSARTNAEVGLRKGLTEAKAAYEQHAQHVRSDMDRLRADLDRTRAEEEGRRRELHEMHAHLQAAQAEIDKARNTNGILEQAMQAKKQEVEALKAEVLAARQALEDEAKRRHSHVKDVAQLTAALDEAQQKLQLTESSKAQIVVELQRSQAELERRTQDYKRLEHDLVQVQEHATAQIMAFSERTEALKNELDAAHNDGSRAITVTDKLRAECDHLRRELGAAQEELLEHNERLHQAENNETALRRELASLQETIKHEAKRAAEERSTKHKQLQRAMEEARTQRAEADAQRREVETLQEALRQTKRQIEKMERENENLRRIETNVTGFWRGMSNKQLPTDRPAGEQLSVTTSISAIPPQAQAAMQPPISPMPSGNTGPVAHDGHMVGPTVALARSDSYPERLGLGNPILPLVASASSGNLAASSGGSAANSRPPSPARSRTGADSDQDESEMTIRRVQAVIQAKKMGRPASAAATGNGSHQAPSTGNRAPVHYESGGEVDNGADALSLRWRESHDMSQVRAAQVQHPLAHLDAVPGPISAAHGHQRPLEDAEAPSAEDLRRKTSYEASELIAKTNKFIKSRAQGGGGGGGTSRSESPADSPPRARPTSPVDVTSPRRVIPPSPRSSTGSLQSTAAAAAAGPPVVAFRTSRSKDAVPDPTAKRTRSRPPSQ